METDNKELIMAYLGGVLDGDGSFSLIKKQEKNKSPLFYPLIQVDSTWKPFIDFIVGQVGGKLGNRAEYIAKDGSKRKQVFKWSLNKSNACFPFLERIVPYLVIKKERAEFLLSYLKDNPALKTGGIRLSDDVLEKRDKAYLAMRSLNQKRYPHGKLSVQRRAKESKDPLFWAYVAGLMDTDGSFSIKRETRRRDCNNNVYSPIVLLSMIDYKSMNYIRNNCLEGDFYTVKIKNASQAYCYRFGIYSKEQVATFLRKILPFMFVKRESALLLLDFCEKYKSYAGPKGVPREEIIFREKCYQAITQANASRYGVYKSDLMDLKPLPDSAGGNKAEAGDKPGTVNVVSDQTSKEDAVL